MKDPRTTLPDGASEHEVQLMLNKALKGKFDEDTTYYGEILDRVAEILESLDLLDQYDKDQNSLLHRCTDRLTELLLKESDKFL